MKALIINLPESTDRFNFQQQQMELLGLDHEFMRAVSTHHLNEVTHYHLAMGWERPIRKTELACFLSHHKAWQIVLRRRQPLLILEDDALLSRHTPALLSLLEKLTDRDLINLEVRGRKKLVGKGAALSAESQLLPLYWNELGAAAYILWPSGASALLERASNIPPALADVFIDSTHKLRSFQVEPAAAMQLDQCEHYQIPNASTAPAPTIVGQKPNPDFTNSIENIRFESRRLTARMGRAIKRLSLTGRSQMREIDLRPEDFTWPTGQTSPSSLPVAGQYRTA